MATWTFTAEQPPRPFPRANGCGCRALVIRAIQSHQNRPNRPVSSSAIEYAWRISSGASADRKSGPAASRPANTAPDEPAPTTIVSKSLMPPPTAGGPRPHNEYPSARQAHGGYPERQPPPHPLTPDNADHPIRAAKFQDRQTGQVNMGRLVCPQPRADQPVMGSREGKAPTGTRTAQIGGSVTSAGRLARHGIRARTSRRSAPARDGLVTLRGRH